MKALKFFSLCLLGSTLASSINAQTLTELYNLAINTDPQWLATKENHHADQELKAQAKALLKPKVGITYSKMRTTQDSPDIGAGAHDDLNQELTTCLDEAGNVTPNCNADIIKFILDGGNMLQLNEEGSSKQSTTVDNFTIQLQQPLFNLENWNRYKTAEFIDAKFGAEYQLSKQMFVLRIAEAYFGILRAEEELTFAKKEQEGIHSQLKQAKQRYNEGISGISDVHEAQSAYDLSRTSILIAKNSYESTLENLNSITDGAHTALSRLKENFPVTAPQPIGMDNWVKLALQGNKNMKSAFHAAKAANHEVIEKNSKHAPTIDLVFNINNLKTDNGESAPFGSSGNLMSDKQSNSLGIQVNIPLYSGGLTSSQVRRSVARSRAAEANLQAEQRRVAAQARNTYRNVINDVQRVGLAKLAIKSSQNALMATQSGYRSGNRNLFDVLQAQRSLFAARRDYATARYDYIINSLRLKQVSGFLSEVDLNILDDWLQ